MFSAEALTDPRRRAAAAAILVSAGLLVPLFAPIASGRVLSRDDLGHFHLPIRDFYARCLKAGDAYLWHPGLFCGLYLHGEGQAGMDHPLHLALYGSLPLATAFGIEMAIGYPILLVGMALWLRGLGLDRGSAMVGAMTFAFSEFVLLRYVHMNAVQVIAHVPWLLLAIDAMATRKTWGMPGFALLTASQGLIGYPQYVGFSLMVAASYALIRFGRSWRDWLRLGLAIGFGLVAAGAQILPQADALAASSRAAPSPEYLARFSLHPLNLIQAIVPLAFRFGAYRPGGPTAWPIHERVAYLGAIVPASCAWIWIRRGELGRLRPIVAWATLLGIAAVALALGRYTPLFAAYSRLPIAGLFRAQSRYVVIAQLAAATLAAVAFADLSNLSARGTILARRSLRPLLCPPALALACGLVLVAVRTFHPEGWRSASVASAGAMASSALWIGVPCLLAALSARGWRLAPLGWVAIVGLDAWAFSVGPILRHETAVAPDRPEAFGPVAPRGPGRLVTPWNDSLTARTRLLGGYVALAPVRRLDPTRPEVRRVAGVSRVHGPGGWSRPESVPLPRFRILARAVPSPDPARDLARIDPGTTALTESPVSLGDGPPGHVGVIVDRPGRIVLRAEAPSRRLLVVSESHHPGWRIAIDGKPADPLRVNGDFLGCVVEEGRHEVSWTFEPSSARVGRILSLAGLALIAGAWAGASLRPAARLTSAARSDEMRHAGRRAVEAGST